MGARGKAKKLNEEQLWEYALFSLGRRAQSLAEIRRKLLVRAEKASDVPIVVAKLSEYQIANDQRFSEMFAAARLQNQGLGKARVLRDLRGKQVPERVATAAVEKAYTDVSEAELIDAFLNRKYRNTDLKEFLREPKNLAAAYRRLRMAGFSSGASISALKKRVALPEDFSEPEEETED